MKDLIYRIYLPSWQSSRNGEAFKSIEQHLGIISELGITIVNLSGIFPPRSRQFNHKLYNTIRDCMTISNDYGGMDDFRSFIHWLQERKIKVVIDLDMSRIWMPQWFLKGIPSEDAIKLIRTIVTFWIGEGVDGFRAILPYCDDGLKPIPSQTRALIGGIFMDIKTLLILECECDGNGSFIRKYADLADYVVDATMFDQIRTPIDILSIIKQNTIDNLAFEFESQKTDRLAKREKVSCKQLIRLLRWPTVGCIIFYQGQEFGVTTPTLSPIPFDICYQQVGNQSSVYSLAVRTVRDWRNQPTK